MSKRKRRAATKKGRPARARRVTKGLQRKPYDGVTPRPSWRRYLQAYSTLLEDGAPVTETLISKTLGISRQSLWRIHRRNPGLRRWVHEQLRERNEHLIGPVINMLGTMAIRTKSPKHAELFLRAVGAGGFVSPQQEEDVGTFPNGYVVNMNFLCPRPEYPQGALAAAPVVRLPPPDLAPGSSGRV